MQEENSRVWIKKSVVEATFANILRDSKSINKPKYLLKTCSNSFNNSKNTSRGWGWVHAKILKSSATNYSFLIIDSYDEKLYNQTLEIRASDLKKDDMLIDNIQEDIMQSSQILLQTQVSPSSTASNIAPDDLITLSLLHEPAVVHSLRTRFEVDKIYTNTGPILIAINPLKQCPLLYSDAVMRSYWTQGECISGNMQSFNNYDDEEKKEFDSASSASSYSGTSATKNLPPHVYAVADDAYRTMMRAVDDSYCSSRNKEDVNVNQSVLVSGESGSGKTVTTKIIMNYLATLSERRSGHASNAIEQQILQSNPILESFGNARTLRNDNSSRFGKYIEIQFHSSGCLVGARIETYLLEKVRLISQSVGERNYHIFYEILDGLCPKERKLFFLNEFHSPKDFKITSLSGTFERRDGVTDQDTFAELLSAMKIMGFEAEEQFQIISLCCALLHASNLTFIEIHEDECKLNSKNPHLPFVLQLLGVEFDSLQDALCFCTYEAGVGDFFSKTFSVLDATKQIEALMKSLYGALFSYLVQRINSSIALSKSSASIGVLDIFGFESFEKNSFEQLCINYCNEALQQQFNHFIFKVEQAEYEAEGITWSFITFPDNQHILDLIDKKRSGILSVLDEQCLLGQRCSDRTFVSSVYDKCASHPSFTVDKKQRAKGCFTIHHYAGPVEYSSTDFLVKNKDEVPKQSREILMHSSNLFVKYLATNIIEDSVNQKSPRSISTSKSSLIRTSVGGQFSQQLQQLRKRISRTTPHYIRCLKPNDTLLADNFDCSVVADQLRCGGILEAIRVSRIGFPVRYTHQRFFQRYRALSAKDSLTAKNKGHLSEEVMVSNLINTVANIVIATGITENIELQQVSPRTNLNREQYGTTESFSRDRYEERYKFSSSIIEDKSSLLKAGMQLGRTKVFLRRWAFDILEQMLGKKRVESIIIIQALARRFLVRAAFLNWLKELCKGQMMCINNALQSSEVMTRNSSTENSLAYDLDGKARILIHSIETLNIEPLGKVRQSSVKKKEYKWIFEDGRWKKNHNYTSTKNR